MLTSKDNMAAFRSKRVARPKMYDDDDDDDAAHQKKKHPKRNVVIKRPANQQEKQELDPKEWAAREATGPLFKFILEACDPDTLVKIQRQVEGKDQPLLPADELSDDEADAEMDAEDMHEEAEFDQQAQEGEEKKNSIRQRHQSKTLNDLVHKYKVEDDSACRSDYTCFEDLVKANMQQLDFGTTDEGIERLKPWLIRIAKVIAASNLASKDTLRTRFSRMIALANAYWVYKGEDLQGSKVLYQWRQIIQADNLAKQAYFSRKDEALASKLRDKYQVDWSQAEETARAWYNAHQRLGNSKETMAQLMLALELSFGCRKGALVDPNIEFLNWPQFKARNPLSDFKIGGDDESGITIDATKLELFEKESGLKMLGNLVCQYGILKDKAQQANRFLPRGEADPKWVSSRWLRKPSIIFTAQEFIAGVKTVRDFFGLKKSTFQGRESTGKLFPNTLFQPYIRAAFPRVYAKAASHGWSLGTHLMRKIYASAATELYSEQIRSLTGRVMDRAVMISILLGHQNQSYGTALSYSVVTVTFPLRDAAFKLPPEQQMTALHAQIAALTVRLEKIESEKLFVASGLHEREATFQNRSNEVVTLKRHVKVKYKDDTEKMATVRKVLDLLEQNGLDASWANVGKMGIGRSVYSWYKQQEVAEEPAKQPVEEPEIKGTHDAVLKKGQYVIYDEPRDKMEKNEFQKLLNKLSLDKKRFGSRLVERGAIQDGWTVEENVNLGRGMSRDLVAKLKHANRHGNKERTS